jgi:DNA-binding transcriptional LysR family regulator
MTFDLKKLRIFIMIVDEGSITAAARRLNVAQPWLSVQLRQLEAQLGFALIARQGKTRAEPTPEGYKLLTHARRAMEAFEAVMNAAAEISGRTKLTLRLGAARSSLHIPQRHELVMAFMSTFPRVDLQIVSDTPYELYKKLNQGELDLLFNSLPLVNTEAEYIKVCGLDVVALMPKEMVKPGVSSIKLSELAGKRICSLNFDYHPGLISYRCQVLAPYKIDVVTPPEVGDIDTAVRYAQMLRLPTLSLNFPASYCEVPEDMVLCSIDHPWSVEWAVIRPHGRAGPALDEFWRLAGALFRDKPHARAAPEPRTRRPGRAAVGKSF